MKRVGENNVAEHVVAGTVVNVERTIHLEMGSEVAGEADSQRVFPRRSGNRPARARSY